ncbi:hypothetical protein [Micromonospora endophytica]|uniref:Uncharacterized protein n=1 Tax=Micromonospora endophytica TaxID=515350 RepID=A0A2W2CYV9_9ACTN|nr:hypothetical protein [Micromonospora endophytica]PZF98594.1 hypothetical protein C1I93_08320 [Micromonospora endophytica]RIW41810.1 hypothetical protein D3H59_24735 [Micromonospora endophytica]BCJ56879.1 hypothetical protein Jiend_03010 [Micromonospora endophytica]
MKKSIIGLVGTAMLVAASLSIPSVASADPSAEILKCRQTRQADKTIPKSQYYTCAWGSLRVIRVSDSALMAIYDGNCANGVWQRNRNATFFDMTQYCPKDGRPRS